MLEIRIKNKKISRATENLRKKKRRRQQLDNSYCLITLYAKIVPYPRYS